MVELENGTFQHSVKVDFFPIMASDLVLIPLEMAIEIKHCNKLKRIVKLKSLIFSCDMEG